MVWEAGVRDCSLGKQAHQVAVQAIPEIQETKKRLSQSGERSCPEASTPKKDNNATIET
jgi:hypothetical protein